MVHDIKEKQRSEKRAPGFDKYPDYELRMRPASSLHQVIFNEAVIAASDNVIIVHEGKLSAVVYFPRADVDMAMLGAEPDTSHCPFKGTASYWSVEANGKSSARAAWSYEEPYADVAALRGYIAFYMDKMDCHWRNGIELPLIGPGPCEGDDCDEQRAA